MIKIFASITVASVFIQIMNYLFIKLSDDSQNILWQSLKIVMMTMPLQIIASLGFVYFYSQGYKVANIPYFYLSLIGVGYSMIMSWLVNILFLNGRMPTGVEILACLLTIMGIGLFVYSKSLN